MSEKKEGKGFGTLLPVVDYRRRPVSLPDLPSYSSTSASGDELLAFSPTQRHQPLAAAAGLSHPAAPLLELVESGGEIVGVMEKRKDFSVLGKEKSVSSGKPTWTLDERKEKQNVNEVSMSVQKLFLSSHGQGRHSMLTEERKTQEGERKIPKSEQRVVHGYQLSRRSTKSEEDLLDRSQEIEGYPESRWEEERRMREHSEAHERELLQKLSRTEDALADLLVKYERLKRGSQLEQRKKSPQREPVDYWKERALKAEKLQLLSALLHTSQLRDFLILKLVAQGCEGAVFLAKCTKRGLEAFERKIFALKVMFNVFQYSTLTKIRSYYQSEYDILSCLPPHENVVRLYAHFYDRIDPQKLKGLPPEIRLSSEVKEEARMLSLFLVMEDHEDTLEMLAEKARHQGQLKIEKVMDWTLQLLTGVQHLLQNCVVHRDLKLNNVLVSGAGILKICDFGSSTKLDHTFRYIYSPGGSLGGNPAHMAPEILNATPNSLVDCSSQDVWAVGVMVFEICGQKLFSHVDQRGYRMVDIPQLRIVSDKDDKVDERFPGDFVALVTSLLQYEPEKRPLIGSAISKLKLML